MRAVQRYGGCIRNELSWMLVEDHEREQESTPNVRRWIWGISRITAFLRLIFAPRQIASQQGRVYPYRYRDRARLQSRFSECFGSITSHCACIRVVRDSSWIFFVGKTG